MPGVDTIEALTAAVQAFDATPLGLQVDRDADATSASIVSTPGTQSASHLPDIGGDASTPYLRWWAGWSAAYVRVVRDVNGPLVAKW